MNIFNFANLVEEVSKVISFGETSQLRRIVQTNVKNLFYTGFL